jgi:hypothetical protein
MVRGLTLDWCLQVDQVRTFDALNRSRNLLFGRDDPPEWLDRAWETMAMDDRQLLAAKKANYHLATWAPFIFSILFRDFEVDFCLFV